MALIKKADFATAAREALVLQLGDLESHGHSIEAEATDRASRIVEEARAERERILAGAHEEGFERGLAQGRDAGRAEGSAAGEKKAYEETKPRLEALAGAFEEQLRALESAREDLVLAARTDLIRLALDIAGRVIKETVAADPSVVAAQFEAAARRVAARTAVVVEVNPEDEPVARAALPGIVRTITTIKSADLAPNTGLSRGSVVLRTAGGGEVDMTLEAQLERIATDLVPPPDAGPPAGDAE